MAVPSNEYLIRIISRKFVFPSRCPVCGEPADEEGSIPAISALDRKAGRDVRFHSYSMGGTIDFKSVTPVRIPTCERHAMKFEDMKRYSAPCGVIGALLGIITIILVLSILRSYAIGLEIGYTEFLFLFLVLFGLYVATTLSRPTALERKLKILDISPDFGNMLILIKNSDYAEELLHLNPMTAERISPIHRNE